MRKVNNDRLAQLIQKDISNIIQFDMKERRVGIVTITDVELSGDNSQAKVFFTILDTPSRVEEDVQNLKRAKGFIRSTLAKKIHTYKVPELIFVYDESLDRGNRIDAILRDINEK